MQNKRRKGNNGRDLLALLSNFLHSPSLGHCLPLSPSRSFITAGAGVGDDVKPLFYSYCHIAWKACGLCRREERATATKRLFSYQLSFSPVCPPRKVIYRGHPPTLRFGPRRPLWEPLQSAIIKTCDDLETHFLSSSCSFDHHETLLCDTKFAPRMVTSLCRNDSDRRPGRSPRKATKRFFFFLRSERQQ